MIKVQPSESRITWSQTPERITMTMPPKGMISSDGILLAVSIVWLAFTLMLLFLARRNPPLAVFVGVIALPGLVGLVLALSQSVRTWSLERDAAWVTLRRKGLFGTRMSRWPEQDVASFWVKEIPYLENEPEFWLMLGSRNGRSEPLVKVDLLDGNWLSAMLTDARGERPPGSPLTLAAEPERRRADPAIVPSSLSCRTFDGGVEITFRPLLQVKGRWWKLPLLALGAVAAVLIVAVLVKAPFVPAVARIAIVGILGWTGWRMWMLQRSALLTVADGLVTVKQNHGAEPLQFGKVDVDFVQTYHGELQFLMKGHPKIRLFEGRPVEELEWVARFLRVAIKGAHEPVAAAMKVDAAAGACQVCLEKMDSRVVYCGKCRTPAHEECWSYMGTCSTYGCREIRFERN